MPLHELLTYLFFVAGFALTPGPNMMLYLAHTFEYGRKAGWATVAGITSAFLFHLAAVVFGLTALLLRWPASLDLLRYAGIAYLLFLAWKNLRSVSWQTGNTSGATLSMKGFYGKGLIGNLLNPGTAVLYFSFIPQFIHPQQGHLLQQNMRLCLLQMAGSTLINSTLVYLGGFAVKFLQEPAYQQRLRYVMSALIAIFAIKMLFSSSH